MSFKTDQDEEEILLPRWYRRLEQLAVKHLIGCVFGEAAIYFWVRHILAEEVIASLHMLIILYGLLCLILAGNKSLEYINTVISIIKKIKYNG